MGLAYISMAVAVLLTLLTVVLYFTLFGPVAVVAMWPVAIVIGAVGVQLHNIQMRNIGVNLLLTTNGSGFAGLGGTLASGARAMAVLVLIGGAALAVYRYGPIAADKAANSVASLAEKSGIKSLFDGRATDELAVATAAPESTAVRTAEAESPASVEQSSVVAQVSPVKQTRAVARADAELILVPASSVKPKAVQKPAARKLPQNPLVSLPKKNRFVDQSVVNLRSGPGTGHSIVDIARRGDRMVQLARQGKWLKVQLADSERTAWIFGGLLKP